MTKQKSTKPNIKDFEVGDMMYWPDYGSPGRVIYGIVTAIQPRCIAVQWEDLAGLCTVDQTELIYFKINRFIPASCGL